MKQNFLILENFFLNLFFPKRCVGCGQPGSFVCFECAGKIEMIKTATCSKCGKITKFDEFCSNCRQRLKTNLKGLIVAAKYDVGPTKEMIHHLKYSGFTELVPLLSEIIIHRIKNNLPKKDLIIVPVPLHKKREAQRGFNQAELIGRELSKRLDIPGGLALSRTRNTQSQVKLVRKDRKDNLVGAFACEDPEIICNKCVLLIDDVTTTGTTLEECTKVLRKNGAREVWGVVIAKRI
jgi:ComF family protein